MRPPRSRESSSGRSSRAEDRQAVAFRDVAAAAHRARLGRGRVSPRRDQARRRPRESSLGLLAEAAHSGTDLAAALLTFFAVSVAVRPADRGHPWGHAKAQNLAALAEAGFLILVSVGIAAAAILRLTGVVEFEVEPTWWVFAAIALVLVIDASRTMVSLRGARLYRSDVLLANALHFGSDFAGTIAVLAGLVAAALGFPAGDSIAALFVSGLVVVAAARLARRNVDVLMDRSPDEEARIARQRSRGSSPRRLRRPG